MVRFRVATVTVVILLLAAIVSARPDAGTDVTTTITAHLAAPTTGSETTTTTERATTTSSSPARSTEAIADAEAVSTTSAAGSSAAGESTTTSAPDSTATTSGPTVTTSPASGASGKGEGQVDLLVNAKSAFDTWTSSPSSSTQAVMRELYDYMVVWSPYFDSRLSWYPNGLAYIDLYAIYTDLDKDQRSVDHPGWILTDSSGERLFIDWGCSGGTCPQWAADVGNPDFQSDFVARVGALVAKGYAGVMIDDVNLLWRISDGSGDTVIPIDPRTGAEMTLSAWQGYVVQLLEKVRSAYPGIKIMHNAIWYADSPGFSNSYVKRQTQAADWIMLERGANDGGLTGGDGKYSLSSFMRFIDFSHGVGTNVLLLDEGASSIADQTYNLGVYLLANDGADLVSTENYGLMAPGATWSGFTADLGHATGPRYRWEGLWRRDFSGGVVLVNEPGAGTISVNLGPGLTDLDGKAVSEVELASTSAAVLLSP